MYTVSELADLTGLPYMTVKNHMKAGKCPWPYRKRGSSKGNIAYGCWENMMQRCTNSNAAGYILYGGRGITIHPLFRSFKHFLEHIGERPSKQHSIDRINNSGNYEPGNVRWATSREQSLNKRCHRNGGTGIRKHRKWYCFSYRGTLQKYRSREEAAAAKDSLYGTGNW